MVLYMRVIFWTNQIKLKKYIIDSKIISIFSLLMFLFFSMPGEFATAVLWNLLKVNIHDVVVRTSKIIKFSRHHNLLHFAEKKVALSEVTMKLKL